jgi:hypothetical protein
MQCSMLINVQEEERLKSEKPEVLMVTHAKEKAKKKKKKKYWNLRS